MTAQEQYYALKVRRAEQWEKARGRSLIAAIVIVALSATVGAVGGILYMKDRARIDKTLSEIPAIRGQVEVIKRGGERDKRLPVYGESGYMP